MSQGTEAAWRRLRTCLCGVMVLTAQAGLMTARGLAAPLDFPDGLPAPSALVATRFLKTNPDAATKIHISEAYGKLPLSFEVNRGQTDSQVKYLARGPGYTLFLAATEAVLALRTEGSGLRTDPSELRSEQRAIRDERTTAKKKEHRANSVRRTVVRMKVVGANTQAKLEGLNELPGNSNYFIGNDPKKWRTNIPHYSKVRYREAYPGIDLVFYGSPRQLEYDFVISPGADPEMITLAFEGVDRLKIDNEGNLILHIAGGNLIQRAPIIYQEIHGARQAVTGHYVLRDKNRIGVHVAAYDLSKPLVIDPVLVYSTYLGGGAADIGNGIAVDGSGNAYVTGSTLSVAPTAFPTTAGAFQLASAGLTDAFVTKLNAAGNMLVYSTYLGGGNADVGNAIAVDGAGNAYVTGSTASADNPGTPGVDEGFPTTVGAFQTTIGNPGSTNTDAFVTKLNTTGTALVYSTYLGGSAADIGNGIAVDGAGNAYVTGSTASADNPGTPGVDEGFPTTVGAFQTTIGNPGSTNTDAFVTKLNTTGTALVYSTYLGGSAADIGNGIAVDGAGNAYVTGSTASADNPGTPGVDEGFPTTSGAFQTALANAAAVTDAFVTKLNTTGTALVYSTYLGGGAGDVGNAITIDGVGNAYVTGSTFSANFPTAGSPFQAALSIAPDAFVTKLNPTGSALVYSTYLGGGAADIGRGIAVDPLDNAYVTGETASGGATPFPTAGGFDDTFNGIVDAFIAKLMESPAGGGGGGGGDGGSGCFIATAAFGSPLVPQVQILREFRDRYLVSNPAGRVFVTLYYDLSPPLAAVIARSETLRALVREALAPIIHWAALTLWSPTMGLGLPLMPAVFGVWLISRGARRRKR